MFAKWREADSPMFRSTERRAAVRSRSTGSRTARADEGTKSSFVDRFRASMDVAEPLRRWSSTQTRHRPQPRLTPVRAHEEGGAARRGGKQAAALLQPASALELTGDGGGEAGREPTVCAPHGSPARPVGSSPERSRAVPRPEPHEPGLKVGIVLMTRRPHRFDFWLAYHRSLGISPFFEP